MIKVRLQVGDGEIKDTYDAYRLIYLKSDNRFAPPTKGFAKSSYPEQAGENVDPRTVDDAFDYSVTFCIEAPKRNIDSVNARIKAFNELMYSKQKDSDIKTFTEFTFYNDHKAVKLTGIPEPIAEVSEDDIVQYPINGVVYNFAVVVLKLRVTDPNKCDWNLLSQKEQVYKGVDLKHVCWSVDARSFRVFQAEGYDEIWGLEIPIKKGSKITITTNIAPSIYYYIYTAVIADESGRQVWNSLDNDLNDRTFTSDYDGTLYVNCDVNSKSIFSLTINNTDN